MVQHIKCELTLYLFIDLIFFSGGIILCQDAWPWLHQQRDLQQEFFWRLEERNDKWWEKDYQRSQKVWLQRNACILCSGKCSEYVLDFFFFVFVRYLWLKLGVRVFELYLVLIVDARICLIYKFKKKIARSILLHPVMRIYIQVLQQLKSWKIFLHVYRVVVGKCNHYSCIIWTD